MLKKKTYEAPKVYILSGYLDYCKLEQKNPKSEKTMEEFFSFVRKNVLSLGDSHEN